MSTSLALPRGVPAWVIHVAIDRERPSIRFCNAPKADVNFMELASDAMGQEKTSRLTERLRDIP